jgi:gamma-glutamylcyclotransferase (GGCT)/AIG2-like uncharacterized protein YtfP
MSDVFVYGTLMRGMPQGALLAHLPREDAWMHGRLYRMPAGYPAIVPGGGGRVYGELVRDVDERLMAVLDRYEGVAEGLYVREERDVLVGLLRRPAFVWIGVDPVRRGGRLLKTGRWRHTVRRGPSWR